MIYEWFI